ncbi:hypothetical protein AK830_g2234 [Neonectria ditissima]|uniref:Protein kinase domain-containing protein n=1 Tax=Neonectria ditissima TaxID=78410 RepID=A0A0N8H8E0_9HYPO|nr:hypothetical protein AK830_g2234 [Neonectria ditissima]
MTDLPDLVRGAELTTWREEGRIVHLRYETGGGRCNVRPVRCREEWVVDRKLRKGGHGDVRVHRCVKGQREGKQRAVKAISKPVAMNRGSMPEVETMANFSQKVFGPAFVKLDGWWREHNTLYIAMELAPFGDLRSYLDENASLPETDVQEIAFQMLEGLNIMHQEKFAHCDIKPDAKHLHQGETALLAKVRYMAPELRVRTPGQVIDYQAADMWSLGVTLLDMLVGTAAAFPWNMPPEDQEGNILRELEKNGVSQWAIDFVQRCMKLAPLDRIKSDQALEHPWLLELNNQGSSFLSTRLSLEQPRQADEASLDTRDDISSEPDPWDTANSTPSTMEPDIQHHTGTELDPRGATADTIQPSTADKTHHGTIQDHIGDEPNLRNNTFKHPTTKAGFLAAPSAKELVECSTESPNNTPLFLRNGTEHPRRLAPDRVYEPLHKGGWYTNAQGQSCWKPYPYPRRHHDTPPPPPPAAHFMQLMVPLYFVPIGQFSGYDWYQPTVYLPPA